ncbi:MAG: enoyl-CoA hydratase/isomerase family protein [Herminiimonas sp.]|nr:enoyl-CoA hydratase/isomerase family protein [Herminiimonas sp.]MDB5854560.1 enoyl-CoA hydratase/isomerase family protein [Herminiimonas sp.]
MPNAAATATTPPVPQETLPLYTVQSGRATIRLNRPAHLNRLHPEDVLELSRLFEEINRDKSIRVVVLTGTGRVFGAGYHLGALAKSRQKMDADAPDDVPYADSAFELMCDALEDLRPPTICRLNGSVYGGATDLALCCDFRIGIDTCEMFMPASRLGLHYYRRGIVRYASRLGVNAAKKLFLTGQTLKAPEMHRIGYLDEVVTADQLDFAVIRLAAVLAAQAPLAVEGMKQSLNEFARQEFDPEASNLRHANSLRSEDMLEGVNAWHEKRKPSFSGR